MMEADGPLLQPEEPPPVEAYGEVVGAGVVSAAAEVVNVWSDEVARLPEASHELIW